MKKVMVTALLGIMLGSMPFTAYADEFNDYDYYENYDDYDDGYDDDYYDDYDDSYDGDYYDDYDDYDDEYYDYHNSQKRNGWYQDSNGLWHFKYASSDCRDEMKLIDGKYYYFNSSGVMVTNKFVQINEIGVGGKMHYFGADGAQVTGWIQSSEGWHYATKGYGPLFPGYEEVIRRGIVYDNGLFYVIDGYTMKTGAYTMEWETDQYYDNAQGGFRDFPYKVGWTSVDLGASGGVTLEQLPVSGGMTDEYYNKMKEQLFGSGTSAGNSSSDAEKFAVADNYVGAAMAEHGIYNYQIQSRHGIEAGMMGGFAAVYYVYIPDQHSYKYLRIYFTADLISGNPIYHYSSL